MCVCVQAASPSARSEKVNWSRSTAEINYLPGSQRPQRLKTWSTGVARPCFQFVIDEAMTVGRVSSGARV